MPLRRFSERQIIYGLTLMQIVGIFLTIWLTAYTIYRWQSFDKVVEANTMNIKGIQKSLHEVGIRPAIVPTPKLNDKP